MTESLTSRSPGPVPPVWDTLPVGKTNIFQGNGVCETMTSVLCPMRQRRVLLDRCSLCPHQQGLVQGAHDTIDAVHCAAVSTEDGGHPSGPLSTNEMSWCTVSYVMTADVWCVTRDVSADALRALLVQHGFGGMPVVDDHGRPLGIVSKTDLVRYRLEHGETLEWDHRRATGGETTDWGSLGYQVIAFPEVTVGDLMTPMTLSISEHDSIALAAGLMAYENVHRLPIISEIGKGRLVGIVTTSDVARWLAVHSGFVVPRISTARCDYCPSQAPTIPSQDRRGGSNRFRAPW